LIISGNLFQEKINPPNFKDMKKRTHLKASGGLSPLEVVPRWAPLWSNTHASNSRICTKEARVRKKQATTI
jgi:hypothetical protein